jgi:hypothetical protein
MQNFVSPREGSHTRESGRSFKVEAGSNTLKDGMWKALPRPYRIPRISRRVWQ